MERHNFAALANSAFGRRRSSHPSGQARKRRCAMVERCQSESPKANPLTRSVDRFSDSESSDSDSSESGDFSRWIQQFCAKWPQVTKVPMVFLTDRFSMEGLEAVFKSKYRSSMSVIAGYQLTPTPLGVCLKDVQNLYLHIHQRFVQTLEGMEIVKDMIHAGVFGYCSRVLCEKNPLIPVQSDRSKAIVGFCTKCERTVLHRKLATKEFPELGIAYGESFPQLLLMNFPELRFLGECEKYVPRIFGFRMARFRERLK